MSKYSNQANALVREALAYSASRSRLAELATPENVLALVEELEEKRRLVHPNYGDCDALLEDGGCAECQKVAQNEADLRAYNERFNKVMVPLRAIEGDDVDRIAHVIAVNKRLSAEVAAFHRLLAVLRDQSENHMAVHTAYMEAQAVMVEMELKGVKK